MAKGYAIKVDGEIDVRTVSPTERAAKVNVLYVVGYPILNSTDDATIEAMWTAHSTRTGNECIEVTITEVE